MPDYESGKVLEGCMAAASSPQLITNIYTYNNKTLYTQMIPTYMYLQILIIKRRLYTTRNFHLAIRLSLK